MSENGRSGGNFGDLSPAQRRAIEALAYGASLEQAATMAERTPRTLRRWRREDPAYVEALRRAGDQVFEDAAVQLRGVLTLAMIRLTEILVDEDVDTHHLLRAIDMTAGHAIRLAEFAELQKRIAYLEDLLR